MKKIYQNLKNHLGKIVVGTIATGTLALIVASSTIKSSESPAQFRSIDDHFRNLALIADMYNGGTKMYGADLDIDNDKVNDFYLVARDGTVYHTNSRRFLTGEDSVRERTFYQASMEVIENAKKGDYPSP